MHVISKLKLLMFNVNSDRKISVWKWFDRTFNQSKVINDAHRYSIHQVELSPSEKTLISASLDGTAIIWDSDVSNTSCS